MMHYGRIIATGSHVPPRKIVNEDLVQFPANARKLIEVKTGIRQRFHADADEYTSDLAIQCARNVLAKAAFDPERIDAVLLATSSPDRMQPAMAAQLQHALCAKNAFAFDINSVCSGGLYAYIVAESLIASRTADNILVVAAEVYSKILNPRDFSTYPYFGDGAGAVLLSSTEGERQILNTVLYCDGSKTETIKVDGGGTRMLCSTLPREEDKYFSMIGRDVFDFAVTVGTRCIRAVLEGQNLSAAQVKRFVLHQANINILTKIAENLGVDLDVFTVNLDRLGNTAAASVFIALDETWGSGQIQPGDKIVLASFGGGLSAGAVLIEV